MSNSASVTTARHHDAPPRSLRPTVPGLGKRRGLGLLSAIHDLARFPRARMFSRIVAWSNVARHPLGNVTEPPAQIGKAHLQGAFLTPPCWAASDHAAAQTYLARWEPKHGQGNAVIVLAQTASACRLLHAQTHGWLSLRRRSSNANREGRGEGMRLKPPWITRGNRKEARQRA